MPVLNVNNTVEAKQYEEFIESCPYCDFMQSLMWAKVKKGWDNRQVYLEKDGKITAAMSILFKKLPFGFTMAYGSRGPAADIYDIKTVQRLIEESLPLLKKRRAAFFKLDPAVLYDKNLEDMYKSRGFKTRNKGLEYTDFVQPPLNMVIDLKDKDWPRLMSGLSPKTRYNIRLAEKKGVYTEYFHSEDALKTFYRLYQVTTYRDKIGARSYEYFRDILHYFGPRHCRIYLSFHEGQRLSGAVAIITGKTAVYLYGASGNEKRQLMPNYRMQAAMIQWAIECGCEKYSLGGIIDTDNTDGLYRFKHGFCKDEGVSEYIGEIDLVINKPMYFLYSYVVPRLLKLKKALIKFIKGRGEK